MLPVRIPIRVERLNGSYACWMSTTLSSIMLKVFSEALGSKLPMWRKTSNHHGFKNRFLNLFKSDLKIDLNFKSLKNTLLVVLLVLGWKVVRRVFNCEGYLSLFGYPLDARRLGGTSTQARSLNILKHSDQPDHAISCGNATACPTLVNNILVNYRTNIRIDMLLTTVFKNKSHLMLTTVFRSVVKYRF